MANIVTPYVAHTGGKGCDVLRMGNEVVSQVDTSSFALDVPAYTDGSCMESTCRPFARAAVVAVLPMSKGFNLADASTAETMRFRSWPGFRNSVGFPNSVPRIPKLQWADSETLAGWIPKPVGGFRNSGGGDSETVAADSETLSQNVNHPK